MPEKKGKEDEKAEKEKEKAKKAGPEDSEDKEAEPETPACGEAAAGEEEPVKEDEGKLSEEEVRKLIEESLENITVSDIVLSMMNQLASVAYLKLGMPENINLKYRDFDQAKLAIDSLNAIVTAAEGKVEGKSLEPFRGTLANLKMNFVQLKRKSGGA